MTNRPVLFGACVSAIVGIVYWAAVSALSGGSEPWDATAFWTLVYPGALLLSAILGFVMPTRAWLWGLIVVFVQVPVVIAVAGADPLLLAGVLYAAVLSIPAALVSGVAGWIRRRMRGAVHS